MAIEILRNFHLIYFSVMFLAINLLRIVLFLSLFLFCFYLNISYNQYNNSKLINSSNSFFSFFFDTKKNISKYFDLEYQNKVLVDENSKLQSLLNNLKIPIKKVAIELNREIIDKKNLNKVKLKKNDKVEIVHFIGGG